MNDITAPGAAGNGTPPTPGAWFAGVQTQNAELAGYMQNRGWHDKAADFVAVEAARAAHEAQKFIGVPSEQLIKLPKDAADAAGWNGVYQKLGVPGDATKYDFSTVKTADGKDVDAGLVDWARSTAASLKLTVEGAKDFLKSIVGRDGSSAAAAVAAREAKIAEEKAQLAKDWGANYVANELLAKTAAEKLGITAEVYSALANTVGVAKSMEMFRSIGAMMSEPGFVGGGPGGTATGNGVMSSTAALAEKALLMADPDFIAKVTRGDAEAVKKIKMLNAIGYNLTDSINGR